MTLYAAYGTNLDPARMSERCPHSPLRTTGWLEGWRLTFGGEEHGWDGALSTIVQDPFEQVFVAVYDVPSQDESALDQVEQADSGLYRKAKVRIKTLTGEVVAWTYVLDAFEGGLPSASPSASSPTPRRRPMPPTTTSGPSAAAPAGPPASDQVCAASRDDMIRW